MIPEPVRPPIPPFDKDAAVKKVRLAEDAWNSRDPERVAGAYTVDSVWRNRSEFFSGREAIIQFLRRKWARNWITDSLRSYGLFVKTGSPSDSRMNGTTTVATGFGRTETRIGEFEVNGYMARRLASINDLPIRETDRKYLWPLARRPDDHPGLSELGL